jgi:Ca2+-binding RTX toxin-like protein
MGIDVILAEGVDGVDIGFRQFGPGSGIEQIVNATKGGALVRLLGNWENNTLNFSQTTLKGGNVLIDAGGCNDTVIGTSGADRLRGGSGDDWLDGGNGGDTYLVRGYDPNWVEGQPYTFEGFDVYADSGTAGEDAIVAEGEGPVDVGLRGFSPTRGIERFVNLTLDPNGLPGARSEVRLLDSWESNLLDFSASAFVGGNILIDGGGGQDTIVGTKQADRLRGGGDDDLLDAGGGGDTYLVSGSNPAWIEGQPYTFEGFDSYRDSGADGVDEIVASGPDPVDIGLRNFGPNSGIERIVNGTALASVEGEFAIALSPDSGGVNSVTVAPAEIDAPVITISPVQILGNWESNVLDFSATQLVGWISVIDAGSGNDTVIGSAAADTIRGGRDSDILDGGGGGDSYLVSGFNPGNPDWETYDFEGCDLFRDSGAATNGIDAIVAVGFGPVDIGFLEFNAASGIEQIRNATLIDDGNGGTSSAEVGLLGNWQDNLLDFSAVTLIGGNFRIAGDSGNDTLIGSASDDRILGGGGDDVMRGGGGNDRYEVSGSDPNNSDWQTYTFAGYDTYDDANGFDTIVAIAANGVEAVDIGLRVFRPSNGIDLIDATATSGRVRLLSNWQDNTLDFSATELRGSNLSIDLGDGNDTFVGSAAPDLVWGGSGSDLLSGRAGDDSITAGAGDDTLDGGEGSDTYFLTGLFSGGWQSFAGYDTYRDSGATGLDRIVVVAANATDAVDIGLLSFRPQSGIELIDATATLGAVRLLGNWQNNTLDFSATELRGSNFSILSGGGNDSVVGGVAADRIFAEDGADTLVGGRGDDSLNGGNGSDTYVVSGTAASGFVGYDTWADSGNGGGEVDRILVAAGTAAVDIGMKTFSAASTGIEQITASTTTGAVRLLGDATANTLNFSGVTLVGANLSIDTGAGNDVVVGSTAADRILAGAGNDTLAGGIGDDSLYGAEGSDTYVVAGTSGFEGYDTWLDSGTLAGEVDRLVAAAGSAAVDIGMKAFSAAATGLEQIDATATTGVVRLLGDATANSFNFTGVALLGGNLRIDGGAGNDTVVGSAGADQLWGGLGDDVLNGAGGSDTYVVSGTNGFEGLDTWADSGKGAGEVDRLVAAAGSGAVDIGMKAFSVAATGLEQIDATATTGLVRLLGDAAANTLNFTGATLLGSNLRIDVGAGNDIVLASAGDTQILAGLGDDVVDAGAGNDTVTGGGGLDSLKGGDGADSFVYTLLTDAITGGSTAAPTFERISDFRVGADSFDISTTPPVGGFRNLGAVAFLTTSGLGTLLNTTNFLANGAATFTYGSGAALRTFIAFNNATAGYSSTQDAIVEITNYTFATGFTSLAQISIV